jgi:hypothetical protein
MKKLEWDFAWNRTKDRSDGENATLRENDAIRACPAICGAQRFVVYHESLQTETTAGGS